MEWDMVANMEEDKVADMEVYMVADIDIQFDEYDPNLTKLCEFISEQNWNAGREGILSILYKDEIWEDAS